MNNKGCNSTSNYFVQYNILYYNYVFILVDTENKHTGCSRHCTMISQTLYTISCPTSTYYIKVYRVSH